MLLGLGLHVKIYVETLIVSVKQTRFENKIK